MTFTVPPELHDPEDDEEALALLWAYAAGALSAAGVPEKVQQSLDELGSAALTAHREAKRKARKDAFDEIGTLIEGYLGLTLHGECDWLVHAVLKDMKEVLTP